MKDRLIKEKVRLLEEQIRELKQEINDIKGQTELECPECKNIFEIKDLTYIRTHWYESPYGCTSGDTWHEGEGNTTCPVCATRLRFLSGDYDTKLRGYKPNEYKELQYYFKEIIEEHER